MTARVLRRLLKSVRIHRLTPYFGPPKALLVFVACSSFLGCAAVNTKTHSRLQYFSPLLSSADVQQIRLLVAARPDIKQPVWKIGTDEGRSDRARVSSGPWGKPGDESDYFYLEKEVASGKSYHRYDAID
jgi:hypothetical protein